MSRSSAAVAAVAPEASARGLAVSTEARPAPVEGDPELLNFPAAIHGWHANYLVGRGAEVHFSVAFCYHPSEAAPGIRRHVERRAGQLGRL